MRSIGFLFLGQLASSATRVLAVTLFALALGRVTSAQDKYAVVIGVETYDTSTFDNLKFAAEDANDIGVQLKSLGFKTTVMSSEAPSARLRPTTPQKVADTIRSVSQSCEEGDTLLIALSGHGVQFSDEDLLPNGVRETYFCPADADLSDKSTLVKISSIIDFMDGSPASRKLLLVDACQEKILSTDGQRKGAKRIELGSVHENRQSVPGGMAVLFSCSSGQYSWEHEPLSHSVFSHHVIEYLKGKADQRYYDAGKLELNGLVSYVSKSTNDYVIGKNLSPDGQLPVLRGSSANWSLGKLKSRKDDLLERVNRAIDKTVSGEEFTSDTPELRELKLAYAAMSRVAADHLIGDKPLNEAETIATITRIEKGLNRLADLEHRKGARHFLQGGASGLFVAPSAELPPMLEKTLNRFLSDFVDELAPFEAARFYGVWVARARANLLKGLVQEIRDDLELCKSLDQLLLEPLSGAQSLSKLDATALSQVFPVLYERLHVESDLGRTEYFHQLKARIETAAIVDRATSEEAVKEIIGATLRMRGAPGMMLLQSMPIEHGLDGGWASQLTKPTLLMFTFCNCGAETSAVTAMRKFREDRLLADLQLLVCCSNDESEAKIKELAKGDISVVRTKDQPTWITVAPFFVLFDRRGRVVTSATSIGDETVEKLTRELVQLGARK